MGSKAGALKVAAKRLGLSEEAYLALLNQGQKHCQKCRVWKPRGEFAKDATRGDGLSSSCHACNRVMVRISTKGRPSPLKGRTMSPEARLKMSEAAKRRPSNRIGKRHTLETRQKISQITRERTPRGSACHTYIDGKGAERQGERLTPEYKQWRTDVYFRDGFACQMCGDKRGGNLNAHHIFAFADYPDLRLNLDNGITLCELCHDRLHHKPESIRNKRKGKNLIRRLRLIRR